MNLNTPALKRLLDIWLDEDIGRGDLSAIAIRNSIGSAHWVSKQKGIFCGGLLVKQLFERLDKTIHVNLLVQEGEKFDMEQKIMELHGPMSSLLAGERTALNLAMHLSGIATTTAQLAAEISGTGVQLVDTRKTTPGLRLLEKYAVRCGGGINHRMGLDDAAMMKENHIAWSDGIAPSIQKLRSSMPWTTKVIVEAETSDQAIEAVSAGADGVLLDGMSPNEINTLVPKLREIAKRNSHNNRLLGKIILEASGIDPTNIKSYAKTGVDLISSSAPVTRSNWIDFSMRFAPDPQTK